MHQFNSMNFIIRKTKIIIKSAAITIFLTSFISCNVVEMYYKIQTHKLKRNGFHEYNISDSISNIHYLAKIEGKPLMIMLHQFSADGIAQWSITARSLSKNFDIIIPDLYYFGKSNRFDSNYSISVQLALIDSIVNKHHLDRTFILLGCSYGGIVSTLYAIDNKEKVEKLFIYSSPVMFFDMSKSDSIAVLAGASSTFNLLCPQTPKEMKTSLSVEFYRPPPIPVFIRKQMIDKLIKPNIYAKLQLLENLNQVSSQYNTIEKEQLPQTYLIWGENDPFIPLDVCYLMKGHWHIPDEKVAIFKNSAHASNLEHNKKFVKTINNFLLK